jgi:hypothetical protein
MTHLLKEQRLQNIRVWVLEHAHNAGFPRVDESFQATVLELDGHQVIQIKHGSCLSIHLHVFKHHEQDLSAAQLFVTFRLDLVGGDDFTAQGFLRAGRQSRPTGGRV